jgi:transcriptional regulator with XRE-family HTH domain
MMTGMDFRRALGEVVREQRLANGLQLRDLAERGFLSYSFLSEVERGLKEASSIMIDRIADGLGVKPYDLIIEAGYRMAGDDLAQVPDTPESLFEKDSIWESQYLDLKG